MKNQASSKTIGIVLIWLSPGYAILYSNTISSILPGWPTIFLRTIRSLSDVFQNLSDSFRAPGNTSFPLVIP
ncbi:hypothetical protein DPX82_26665 [Salmonella enterica]|nr:hypothetical protein [Salmonella enterica]EBI2965327.1 hypothetical protein [Salmonella enterica]EBI7720522.1 hypothetical protein [Salmonella enterica]EBJ7848473.1 hypothetical protein [Salmonella enterica]EBS3850696.1 hypothetical protein [Salmonella enterica subsp. enterica serovar Java]